MYARMSTSAEIAVAANAPGMMKLIAEESSDFWRKYRECKQSFSDERKSLKRKIRQLDAREELKMRNLKRQRPAITKLDELIEWIFKMRCDQGAFKGVLSKDICTDGSVVFRILSCKAFGAPWEDVQAELEKECKYEMCDQSKVIGLFKEIYDNISIVWAQVHVVFKTQVLHSESEDVEREWSVSYNEFETQIPVTTQFNCLPERNQIATPEFEKKFGCSVDSDADGITREGDLKSIGVREIQTVDLPVWVGQYKDEKPAVAS